MKRFQAVCFVVAIIIFFAPVFFGTQAQAQYYMGYGRKLRLGESERKNSIPTIPWGSISGREPNIGTGSPWS